MIDAQTPVTSSSPLNTSEFFLQLIETHLYESRSAVWAGVRHIANLQIIEQFFKFRSAQHVVGFYRVPTHSLGNDVFAQTQLIDITGFFQCVDDIAMSSTH